MKCLLGFIYVLSNIIFSSFIFAYVNNYKEAVYQFGLCSRTIIEKSASRVEFLNILNFHEKVLQDYVKGDVDSVNKLLTECNFIKMKLYPSVKRQFKKIYNWDQSNVNEVSLTFSNRSKFEILRSIHDTKMYSQSVINLLRSVVVPKVTCYQLGVKAAIGILISGDVGSSIGVGCYSESGRFWPFEFRVNAGVGFGAGFVGVVNAGKKSTLNLVSVSNINLPGNLIFRGYKHPYSYEALLFAISGESSHKPYDGSVHGKKIDGVGFGISNIGIHLPLELVLSSPVNFNSSKIIFNLYEKFFNCQN